MNVSFVSKWWAFFRQKPVYLTVAGLVVACGLWATWRHLATSPPPWYVRWQVMRYLKSNSTSSNFEVPFQFPSKAEMAKGPSGKNTGPPKGSRTGKDFETLCREYLELKTSTVVMEREIPESVKDLAQFKPRLETLTKRLAELKVKGSTNTAVVESQIKNLQQRLASLEKTSSMQPELDRKVVALEPITADLWEFQRRMDQEMASAQASGTLDLAQARGKLVADLESKFDTASTYEAMYRLIGQQLWVTERLLKSRNPDHRREAVRLALNACRNAIEDAQNGWVAARICEGFVWPNIDLANDANRRSFFNLDNLLNECANIFRRNEEIPNVARTYAWLVQIGETPQRRDSGRAQMAMAYEQGGFYKEALEQLRQIKSTNDFSWAIRRIPRIEAQMKAAN
jgi:hypothetical protein